MMSHPLPKPVRALLQRLTCAMEEGLGAQAHTVGLAVEANRSFDTTWLESHLIRAVIAGLVHPHAGEGLRVEDLGNGGIEIVHVHEAVERRFRMRKAKRGRRQELVVTTSSDSMLTLKARDATLFDDEATRASSVEPQQWVLAYVLHPGTHTFNEVFAARVVGVIGNHSPYRLDLADVVRIPHDVPLPPEFKPESDDLDMPDVGEDRGEQAG